jgi:hypothetical protein
VNELRVAESERPAALEMAEAERLITLLRSLPSVRLRVSFLQAYVGHGERPEVARNLDALCAVGRRETDKDALFAVVFLLSGMADDPVLDRVGQHAAAQRLENLGRLLRRGAVSSQPPPSKAPLYSTDRELSLGERRALARQPSRRLFDKLLTDPEPLVIERLLENPRLTEDDVVRLIARRPALTAAHLAVARTPWISRRRVRLSLMQNPGTPPAIAVPLVALCSRPELRMISQSQESSEIVRVIAHELLWLTTP